VAREKMPIWEKDRRDWSMKGLCVQVCVGMVCVCLCLSMWCVYFVHVYECLLRVCSVAHICVCVCKGGIVFPLVVCMCGL
jgi:hypothetical protein